VIYGLKATAQEGLGPVPALSILAGLFIGVLFVRRQLALADPLIDISLFRIPSFSTSLATNVLSIFVALGYFLFVAQYLQLVLGLKPLQAGLWSLPSALGFIVGSNIAPRILPLFRPAYVLCACLALAALGLGLLTQVGGSNGLATVVIASVIVSLALAPVFSLTTELIVGSAPPERAGAASGISETAAELGGALGIAILGSIGAAIYRSELAHGLPAAVPTEAAMSASDTLGAAVNVAEGLPDGIGMLLLQVARDAFVQGMQLTAAIAALVAITIAILVLVMLRNVPASSEPQGRPGPHAEEQLQGLG
jgi:DHA2 family multidrug resistance protein-like MFS transporter